MNLTTILFAAAIVYAGQKNNPAFLAQVFTQRTDIMSEKIQKSDNEWKNILTPIQYNILRGKGTETPFTGQYNNHSEKGIYLCAACGNPLFSSDEKFSSHCGWPSFSAPANTKNVAESPDTSHNMTRTEITCSKCGGHLGHVFNDGPGPNGLRYCINSAALKFQKKE